MLRQVKNDLKGRMNAIIQNDRSAIKNQKSFKNQVENVNKQPINNVIAITPFLKRDAGFDGGFSA